MQKAYEHVSVKEIKINEAYTGNGTCKVVNHGKEGIKVDIELINSFRKISKIDKIRTYSEHFHDFANHLNIDKRDSVRWDLLLNERRQREYVATFLSELRKSIAHLTTYHFHAYPRRLTLYENLVQVVNKSGDIVELPTYIHESLTGRTSIREGFNFLTCTKATRESLRSQNKDRSLIEIDFRSCEPSLYLKARGIEVGTDDVYTFLAAKLNLTVKDRSILKRGILSVLYGANSSTSQKLLGGSSSDLRKIKEFFEVEDFENALRAEFKEHGCIFNLYGRPVYSDKSLINKWIQSSAVDFCNLAFLDFVLDTNVKPCFTVHDSITVECDNKDLGKISSMTTLTESMTNISLPVDINVKKD
tara:strand:+ start:1192 stop:2271 length:1080 start_codon:yes stop_codon:yes gene_type:complete